MGRLSARPYLSAMLNSQSAGSRLHFKEDSVFREYLLMGEAGEKAVLAGMRRLGHEFRFNDDGAGSSEIFKDASRKRKRKSDLVCAKCGQLLEVRAKRDKVRVAMSDSAARPFDRELPHLAWVAFVPMSRDSQGAWRRAGRALVTSIGELSRQRSKAVASGRKGERMGNEAYLWWPLEYAGVTGRVVGIEAERAFIETPRGLFPTLLDTRFRAASEYEVLAREGDVVRKGVDALWGVVRTLSREQLVCPGATTLA